jgi:hypothetical protein
VELMPRLRQPEPEGGGNALPVRSVARPVEVQDLGTSDGEVDGDLTEPFQRRPDGSVPVGRRDHEEETASPGPQQFASAGSVLARTCVERVDLPRRYGWRERSFEFPALVHDVPDPFDLSPPERVPQPIGEVPDRHQRFDGATLVDRSVLGFEDRSRRSLTSGEEEKEIVVQPLQRPGRTNQGLRSHLSAGRELDEVETPDSRGVMILLADRPPEHLDLDPGRLLRELHCRLVDPLIAVQRVQEPDRDGARRAESRTTGRNVGKGHDVETAGEPRGAKGFPDEFVLDQVGRLDDLRLGIAHSDVPFEARRDDDVDPFVHRRRDDCTAVHIAETREVGAAAGQAHTQRCSRDDQARHALPIQGLPSDARRSQVSTTRRILDSLRGGKASATGWPASRRGDGARPSVSEEMMDHPGDARDGRFTPGENSVAGTADAFEGVMSHDGLPLLRAALDPGTIRAALEGLLPGVSDLRAGRVLSLQRGSRALVSYELASEEGTQRVFGKLFSEPIRAERFQRTLTALWNEATARQLDIVVPRPLGWLPELNLVLYEPLDGPSLEGSVAAGDRHAMLRAGRGLAQLHSCRPPLDRRFDLSNELVNLDLWANTVSMMCPPEGWEAPALAKLLEQHAPGLRLGSDTPIHKDIHPHHLIVGPKLGVIDFDEMRWGDANFDVAHFCVYLHLAGVRSTDTSSTVGLQRAFVEGYAGPHGWTLDERFLFFGVYACLKVARQLCAETGVAPIPTGAERRRQLRAILERGRLFAEDLR